MTITLRGPALTMLLVLGVLPLPARAQTDELPFAVTGGALWVNETGQGNSFSSFNHFGGYLAGDVVLERNVTLETRLSRFDLPGSVPNSPAVETWAGTLSVQYAFREAWWRVGLFGGLGGYRLLPKAPQPGQIPVDAVETTWGWNFGVLTAFDLSRSWELRVEVAAHLLRDESQHRPVFVSSGLAFRF